MRSFTLTGKIRWRHLLKAQSTVTSLRHQVSASIANTVAIRVASGGGPLFHFHSRQVVIVVVQHYYRTCDGLAITDRRCWYKYWVRLWQESVPGVNVDCDWSIHM